ncbi:MAG: MarR family transcriptional regulator [Oligoflexia bacterium]|nr:MarR family transcriptional regulator [Oligoflexia bacterium]
MFFLQKLPTDHILQDFSKKYPDMQVVNVSACLHLLKVASELLRELEGHFSKNGLSQARFLALIVLEREKSHQLKCIDMTQALGVSKPNITRLLDSLEADGLIERRGSKEDKRCSMIAITTEGSRALASVLPGYYRIMNQAMKPFDSNSKEKLIQLLGQVATGS